jgi:hypothetical protein
VAAGPGNVVVHRRDGAVHEHLDLADGWRVDITDGQARSSVLLGGLTGHAIELAADRSEAAGPPAQPLADAVPLPAEFRLGESSYRRSEASWHEAGSPEALVYLESGDDAISLRVIVPASHRCFVPVEAANPFDNEPAAINGDGVQLYLRVGERTAAWLLVPRATSSAVGVRPVGDWGHDFDVEASWAPWGAGYELHALVPLHDAQEVELDLIVNETVPERARRRGQLVLSGGDGEFVYLRGDRHDHSRLLRFSLSND